MQTLSVSYITRGNVLYRCDICLVQLEGTKFLSASITVYLQQIGLHAGI